MFMKSMQTAKLYKCNDSGRPRNCEFKGRIAEYNLGPLVIIRKRSLGITKIVATELGISGYELKTANYKL